MLLNMLNPRQIERLDALGSWVAASAIPRGRIVQPFLVYHAYELMKSGLSRDDIGQYFRSQERYQSDRPFMSLLWNVLEEGYEEFTTTTMYRDALKN